MIEIEDFKKKYPKGYKLLLELYSDSKLDGLLGTQDKEQALEMALIYSPRFLFDWFDKQEIYLSIFYDVFNGFLFSLITEDKMKETDNNRFYKTRGEAELAAFLEAFKIIEAR